MKAIALLIIAIFFSASMKAQQLLTKDQREVQQAIVKMFESLSNRDSLSLKASCTADVTFYEYGKVWSLDTMINKAIKLNKAADFKRTNTIDFINTTTDKTTAWATYRLYSAMTKDSKQTKIEWLETVVLIRQKKQWKIKHLHSTLIKRV
jgi:hypothetical protein